MNAVVSGWKEYEVLPRVELDNYMLIFKYPDVNSELSKLLEIFLFVTDVQKYYCQGLIQEFGLNSHSGNPIIHRQHFQNLKC